ncbi:MAG: hypothetical protein ABIA78_00550 [archaeon]
MDIKAFIGVIFLPIGVYTILLALEMYELSFVPSNWVIIASGTIVAIYSLKYFKYFKSSSGITSPSTQ